MPADKGGGAVATTGAIWMPRIRRSTRLLIASAEAWLPRTRSVKRCDRPHLHVDLGRARPAHQGARSATDGDDGAADGRRYARAWVEAAGYAKVKNLHTWELDITKHFLAADPADCEFRREELPHPHPPRRQGEEVPAGKRRSSSHILNDAWKRQLGALVPFTRRARSRSP